MNCSVIRIWCVKKFSRWGGKTIKFSGRERDFMIVTYTKPNEQQNNQSCSLKDLKKPTTKQKARYYIH